MSRKHSGLSFVLALGLALVVAGCGGSDTDGGANLASALSTSANGVAVVVDDSTIEDNGSGQLRVKPNGIDSNELDMTAGYDFATAGGGVQVTTQTGGTNTTDAASTAFVQQEIAGLSSENARSSIYTVLAGDVTNGYFDVTGIGQVVNGNHVQIFIFGGTMQQNLDLSATGADFEVTNEAATSFRVKINANSTPSSALSGDITTGRKLLISWQE